MTETNPRTEERLSRPALMIGVILAACILVAVSAKNGVILRPASDYPERWVSLIRLAGGVAAFGGLVWLIRPREAILSAGGMGFSPTRASLIRAAFMMAMIWFVATMVPNRSVDAPPSSESETTAAGDVINPALPSPDLPLQPSNSGENTDGYSFDAGRDYESLSTAVPTGPAEAQAPRSEPLGIDWSFLVPWVEMMLVVLLAVLVGLCWFAIKGRGTWSLREFPEAEEEEMLLGAAHGLRASLRELSFEGDDPRSQIMAAYHTLLASMRVAGMPRQPYEAPHEHLYRTLTAMELPAEPLHQLTRLYVQAQYSDRPLSERHRTSAVEALRTSLQNLRVRFPSLGLEFRPSDGRGL